MCCVASYCACAVMGKLIPAFRSTTISNHLFFFDSSLGQGASGKGRYYFRAAQAIVHAAQHVEQLVIWHFSNLTLAISTSHKAITVFLCVPTFITGTFFSFFGFDSLSFFLNSIAPFLSNWFSLVRHQSSVAASTSLLNLHIR